MREFGDGVEEVDASGWYLTQAEEYGRRLHADERRLMYVALTRAREDALMTYCAYTGESGRDPSVVPKGSRAAQPSNFWLEVHDALQAREHAISAQDCVERLQAANAGKPMLISAQGEAIATPEGFFIGEHAAAYGDAVVGEAWQTPITQTDAAVELPWPATLSDAVHEQLSRGIDVIAADSSSLEQHQDAGPLLQRAQLLVDDADLMADAASGQSLDEAVKAKAQRVLAAGRQNVTSLQARVGGMSEREERLYWRSIIRPIPRISSPAAEAGTQFHAWAEQFINAGKPDEAVLAYEAESSMPHTGQDAGFVSREAMLADLAERERQCRKPSTRQPAVPQPTAQQSASAVSAASATSISSDNATESKLVAWQRRLAESSWAKRIPAWTERAIVVDVPGVGLVNGKLDAVFIGGLDPSSTTARFTVVDWKTGRRPTKPDDITRKLAQLDMYRLLLAAVEGVELDSIDATLYYVSEPDEGLRELHARAKTKQEILTELSSGIPEQSDND